MSDFEKLINASDLIEWIMETYPDWCVGAIRGIVDHINELPSVQPRMKGKWIYGENDCQDGWFCSECRFFIPWDYDYYGLNNINFIKEFHVCPHCKAEMVTYTGKKENTDEHSG